ncbi:hypothetical protein CVT23_04450 [Minwuia thermotolerans]|uniref:Uncharacterized protein n=2 Tax=Minwuia thermotolerans TaxID=2056226 RepID=A0A2M9G572_9PROT|nr:hypothetical protein CVT23_04450 [Minwuia thermotolerans]
MAELALSAVASVDREDGLFTLLHTLPASIMQMRSAAAKAKGRLAERLFASVDTLIASDRPEEAAHALVLTSQIGANPDRVQALSKDLHGRIVGSMREAVAGGRDKEAFDLAQTLVWMAPASSEGWLTAGRMLLKFDRNQEALAALRQAVEHGQSSQNALLNLARAEIRCGLEREGMLTLFKLLRIAEADDGRYTPLALTSPQRLVRVEC